MNIREAVARAIYAAWWHEIEGFLGDPYFGSNANLWKNWLPAADAAITAFLDAAAKEGWSMYRDEATDAMLEAGMGEDGPNWPEPSWRAMCAASPKFELDGK